MNRNLFTKELKRDRKNLFIWSAIVMVLTFLVMSIYPFMRNIGAQVANVLKFMPAGFTKGMGIDIQSWNSILGLYSTYYGIYIIVILGIFGSSTGATIISKEERDRTAEFLLTKPVTRKTIFITKVISLFTLVFFVYTAQTLTAITGILIFGEGTVSWTTFVTMHLNGLLLVVFFTCLGVLLPMFIHANKNLMGLVVGIVFGTYFFNAIAKAAETFRWLGYISPFHYLDLSISNPNFGINYITAGIFLLTSLVLLFLSNKVYEKKDIGT
jgi:ABC-2 type transport system permease protein